MLCLDHITIIAPSLAEGVEHVRACLDFDVPYGGTHPTMGTHNHVIRIGKDVYLEVIAVNPSAPAPPGPRWFGLGDPEAVRYDWANGRRLRGWVARTDDIDTVLGAHGALFGGKIDIGKASQISMPGDGSLPRGGVLPSVIDRGGQTPRGARLEDHDVNLRDFVLEHPSPDEIETLYEEIGIQDPPLVRMGSKLRYFATIETARGIKTLH